MRCIENIKDIALDCKYRPTKGLKHRVLVIPYKDIDRRYTAMNEDKSVITHFQLYPTKRGYLFELSNAFKVNGSQKLSGGFVHELSIKIDKANSDNIATMNALTKGAYVLVVETMSNTFEILGYDAGVVVSSIQRDYAGNVIGLTFATPSDVKELRMVALWGEGDYLTMSKKFERKAFVGKNLILNSKSKRTMNGYIGTFYLLNEPTKSNEQYIFSCIGDIKGITHIYFSDELGGVPRQYINTDLQNGKIANLIVSNREWRGITIYHEVVGIIPAPISSIELLKLEQGNIATDWCPADED
jgi:hypothetical protein